jgi:hypothetical protein
MIRINRNPTPPTSLQRPEIAQYLRELQAYKIAIEQFECGEIQTEPIAPRKPGSYRSFDLLDAFEEQFFSKCYLTEAKFEDGAELEADHFITQSENDAMLYDWHNLFPISPLANKLRPKTTPPGGYLNPCIEEDDVESEILYRFVPALDIFEFEAKDDLNAKAINTAKLLHKLHNGDNETTRRSTAGLRKAVKKLHQAITEEYVIFMNPHDEAEKRDAAAKLRKYFSRTAAFTMLMRNCPSGRRLKAFHQD